MALEGQQSLFGFPAGAKHTPVRRKELASNRRMVRIQCQGCGGWFMSFVRGINCDDCRKQKRKERRQAVEEHKSPFIFYRTHPEFVSLTDEEGWPLGY